MPDELRAHKLSDAQQQQVLQLICEGYKDQEIADKLKKQHGVEITREGIRYYRQEKFADLIDELHNEALKERVRQGYANRLRRLDRLERLARKLEKAADEGTPKDALALSPEIRAVLRDMRDELGDLKVSLEMQVDIPNGDVKRFIETLGQVIHEHVSDPDKRAAILSALEGAESAPPSLDTEGGD